MAEEQHRLDQLQLDEDRQAGVVAHHVSPRIERPAQAGRHGVVRAAGQVQHVSRRLVHRHVLGLALHGRLADPQQRLLAHAMRELAVYEDHGGLRLCVDQVAVRLQHHRPPGRVQLPDVPAGGILAGLVVGSRAVGPGRNGRLHHKLTGRELRSAARRNVLCGHHRDAMAGQIQQIVLVEVPLDRLGRVEEASSQAASPAQEPRRGTEVVLGRPDHHGVEVIPADVAVPDHRHSSDALLVQGLDQLHAFRVQSSPVRARSDRDSRGSGWPPANTTQLDPPRNCRRKKSQYRQSNANGVTGVAGGIAVN